MKLRKSTINDIDRMVEIALEGKQLLKESGINQWQVPQYPSRDIFLKDLDNGIGYVLEDKGKVMGICAIIEGVEETYNHLISGAWLTNNPYMTIHRGAISQDTYGHHTIDYLFEGATELAKSRGLHSLRADTHEDNIRMRKALERNGFKYCGEVNLLWGFEKGTKRVVYEKVF